MGKERRNVKVWGLILLGFVATNYIGVACSKSTVTTISASPATSTSTPTEAPYCNTSNTFADQVTVSGSATFNVRSTSAAGLGAEISRGPVQFAEVQILSAGSIINCGTTDTNGGFSLNAPRNQSLTVKINSRSQTSHVNVSVLDSPYSNNFYSLTSSFSTSVASGAPVTVPPLIASAAGDVMGGAFNIYFNILRANESLRYILCGTNVDTTCANFSVAPKVTAYWAKGVNPYTYFGYSSALSFYGMGTGKLYILGGINGDVDNSDTDHFDDAVISHEYGHFIEDIYGHSDSPGGGHDGSSILDARLMWSEGWADFFSSLVRGDKFYRDTYGNISGSGAHPTGTYFNYDIEKNFDTNYGSLDVASANGEGNFHEFAITRALWDYSDPVSISPTSGTVGTNGTVTVDDNSGDNSSNGFQFIWSTFSGILKMNNAHFRSIGLILANDADPNIAANPNVISFQRIIASTQDYAKPLPITTGAGCGGTNISITAKDISYFAGANSPNNCNVGDLKVFCSNQFASNDFYDVNYDGSFSTISLTRTSGNAEIDLYLYTEKYVFGDTATMVATSTSNSANQSISLSSLAQGHYLLNVNVNTKSGNPPTQNYQLFVNGAQICP
jgi:hypothetical protein